MKDKTIVMLAKEAESTNIIYNSLKDEFLIERVIIERPMPKAQLLKKRLKRLGIFKAFGQLLFRLIAVPSLRITSRRRIAELKKDYDLNDAPVDASKIINVISANSDETISILKRINPRIVIINGTRILSDRVINCMPAKFINMHTGITPSYRGVYGAYWALVENNKKACGVTVHLVDKGIDTGGILGQGIIDPKKEDNIVTYPLLQLAAGIPLLKKAVKDIFEDGIKIKPYPAGLSKLWSHPTLLGYIRRWIRQGVK